MGEGCGFMWEGCSGGGCSGGGFSGGGGGVRGTKGQTLGGLKGAKGNF